MTLDISNILYGKTMVPIPETSDAANLEYILELTKINTLFVSSVACNNLIKINKKHNLKNLVIIDSINQEFHDLLKHKGFKIFTY